MAMITDYFNLLGFWGTAGGAMLLIQFFGRNRSQLETHSLFTRTYGEVLDNLRQEVSRLSAKVQEMERTEKKLLIRIENLEKEIHNLRQEGSRLSAKVQEMERMEKKLLIRIENLEKEIPILKYK